MLVLEETMTLSTDSFDIAGHTLIGRIDCNARIFCSGKHIYFRIPALCKFLFTHSSSYNGARIEMLVIEFYYAVITDGPVLLLSIYRSPQSPINEVYSELDHVMRKTDNLVA